MWEITQVMLICDFVYIFIFIYSFFFSYAYIIFKTHEEALKVFNASRNLKIQGKDVIVIFSTYKSGNDSKENENQSVTPVTKKQKVRNYNYTNTITSCIINS